MTDYEMGVFDMCERVKLEHRQAMLAQRVPESLILMSEQAHDAMAENLINNQNMRHQHQSVTDVLLNSRTSDGDSYDDELPIDLILDGLQTSPEGHIPEESIS